MALDNAQFMSELSISDPPNTDPASQGADQIRTSKRTQFQSFPNIDKEVTASADDLNTITGAATTGAPLVPVSTMLDYAGLTAPVGYLLCDGAAIDPQYTELIAIVGLNTPNFRGKFARGWSDDAAVDPDGPRAPLDAQAEDFKSHVHDTGTVISGNTEGSTNWTTIMLNQSSGTDTDPTGGDETRPVNIAVLKIIKW